MHKGFLYLYAIIDVYSRYIVGWGLYSTLESCNAIEVLDAAVARHGKPEIINSDQGSQYTCAEWIETLKRHSIQISMDGRGRCRDNAWIEVVRLVFVVGTGGERHHDCCKEQHK